ncbi:MAG: AI-2E family transporter, partial [Streptococcus sp.]
MLEDIFSEKCYNEKEYPKESNMEHKEKDFSLSWFFRWFLDNK